MGPFPTKSFGGASYVLTFIDDFSRITFGYLIEHKDQTFDRNEFNYFCTKYGIKR